jgi:phosphosulfolactate phosphohydrolase-like enzyme
VRQDWLKSYCIGTVCDLTASNGVLAFQALQQNVCYLGVCYNDHHMVELYKHLADLTFDAMWTEGSALYDAKLAELLKGEGEEGAKGKENKEKKKKPDGAEEAAGSSKKQKKSSSSADSLLAQLQALRGTGKKAAKATEGEEEEENDEDDV